MRQRGKILVLLGAAGLLASSAGAGFYQRTLDSNALVWNDQRQSGEEATWSGRKDAQGYATGYGTLTWYSRGKLEVTGSSIPSRRRFGVVATYYGNMVRGKFLQRGK